MSAENANPTGATFAIRAQYVKDLSFENPHAPDSLRTPSDKPQIEVGMDLGASRLQTNLFEVALKLSVKASAEGKVMFMTELTYAAVVELSGISDDKIEPVLMVDVPFIVFPFARRVIADATRDGGFPPLLLEPMDFRSLYLQKATQAKAS